MSRVWRTVLLLAAILGLAALFLFVMMRSGPLAPVSVTAAAVERRSVAPALYGIGVVESGAVYRVGPTSPGRVREVFVEVGDRVESGQKVAVMDPVDLDQRVSAQKAHIARLEASVRAASARTSETGARKEYAQAQSKRYDNLLKSGAVSVESGEAKRQERLVTAAAWASANADLQASRGGAGAGEGRSRGSRVPEGKSRSPGSCRRAGVGPGGRTGYDGGGGPGRG